MNKIDFISTLTQSQREEFDIDIKNLILRVAQEYNFDPTKVAVVHANMRLSNEVFINVSIAFNVNVNGQVNGEIEEIKRFNSVDEYLDAINEGQSSKPEFTNLKP